jgi:hypothetical protein
MSSAGWVLPSAGTVSEGPGRSGAGVKQGLQASQVQVWCPDTCQFCLSSHSYLPLALGDPGVSTQMAGQRRGC